MRAKRVSMLVAAATCALAAGSVFAADADTAHRDHPVKDTYITTKVKAELAKDSATKAHEIKVTTKDGVVALSGIVGSKAEKEKAETDARGIKGVVDVNNGLEVKE
ncbi:MAG TPA: BON domain-containing protein [Steroidobacteraceae bacterium]|nr:BON domain-containing protein [Steroidobacteraceae bacterium]